MTALRRRSASGVSVQEETTAVRRRSVIASSSATGTGGTDTVWICIIWRENMHSYSFRACSGLTPCRKITKSLMPL